jgi:hypothetical protein
MFPTETPLGDDLVFAFLAVRFPLCGGNIKNAALKLLPSSPASNFPRWQIFNEYYCAIHGKNAEGQSKG